MVEEARIITRSYIFIDYTLNAREGSYLPAITGNSMLSGVSVGLFANPMDQMRFDGVTTMDIAPNSNRPDILSTLMHQELSPILFTPDDNDRLFELSRLSGFMPSMVETWQEYFPINEQEITIFYKDYPDTVDKINGRYPINGDLAGKQYTLPEDLQELYPEGVLFKENGHPDFTPYADITVEVEDLTGTRWSDEQKANKAAGLDKKPAGKTWHHVEDGKTMQLVPEDLHYQVRHTGGAALLKDKGK